MNRSFLSNGPAFILTFFIILPLTVLFPPQAISAQEKPYFLKWGANMSDYLHNNIVEFPDIDEGEMKNFPIHVKVIDKNTKKGVQGIKIRFKLLPDNSVMLNRSKPVTDKNGTAQMRGRFPSVWGPKAGENRIAITAEDSENTLYACLFGIPTYVGKTRIYLVIDKTTLELKNNTKATIFGRAKLPQKPILPPGHSIEVQVMGNNTQPQSITPSQMGRFTFHIDPPKAPGTVYFTVTLLDNENNKAAIQEGNVRFR